MPPRFFPGARAHPTLPKLSGAFVCAIPLPAGAGAAPTPSPAEARSLFDGRSHGPWRPPAFYSPTAVGSQS